MGINVARDNTLNPIMWMEAVQRFFRGKGATRHDKVNGAVATEQSGVDSCSIRQF